ncbi:hypothetical protein ACFQ9X_48480 [Catenulispora yoronensis]
MTIGRSSYDASHITVLSGEEAVRKRPGLYIGSTGERGLQNMVSEAIDRAATEVLAGRATRVDVTLTADGGVRVTHDAVDGRVGAIEDDRLGEELSIVDYGARGGTATLWATPLARWGSPSSMLCLAG